MTPFMVRVHQVVTGSPHTDHTPELMESVPRTIGQGTHEHVELRALAEQLVAEANAVLSGLTGEPIRLQDGSGTRDQTFSLSRAGNWATVTTSYDGGVALAGLSGPAFPAPRRELAGEDALADLILTLVAPGRRVPTTAGAVR
ncbi:hypothetical protein [Streptomyces sp. NPDC096012]|uniref:hypothetical protein n=1 Tax=Streptomyces sp. NPDC096012 TaxID=3155684 RepID=UPI00336A6E16